LQLADEKARSQILQRHETEYKKEVERLQEKSSHFEDNFNQIKYKYETTTRDFAEKERILEDNESKLNKLQVDLTNQKNQFLKKEKDYQNALHTVYNDLTYCTESLSSDSDEPYIVLDTPLANDIETWLSKVKAKLAWLKQELDARRQRESKLRQDLNNALLDSDADRKYFATELAKKEVLVDEMAREKLNLFDMERETSDKMKFLQTQLVDLSHRVEGHSVKEIERARQLQTVEMQLEYEKRRALTEDEKDRINDRYRQQLLKFQTMIDSIKRDLQSAKVQLFTKSP
ncbi:unnamed protein product, partial [Didymodactylos carnosus]